MAGGLLEIRKKIAGIKNTRKITKAMQLVAASKMRQFQKRAVGARKYAWDLLKILQNNIEVTSAFSEERTEGATLFVIYTSDKGLCGPLNTKLINGLFRSEMWSSVPAEERLLITIGKKSYDFARNNKIPVEKHFVGIPEKISNLDAISIVEEILKYWTNGKAKKIIFVAPHYKNSFTFYPVLKTFLPFSGQMIKSITHTEDNAASANASAHNAPANAGLNAAPSGDSAQDTYMLYQPSQKKVVENLHQQIIESLFLQSFLELKASEYSSRMMAMQSATDSADRISNELSLIYNKARQQAITQEIAELVGASDAIS